MAAGEPVLLLLFNVRNARCLPLILADPFLSSLSSDFCCRWPSHCNDSGMAGRSAATSCDGGGSGGGGGLCSEDGAGGNGILCSKDGGGNGGNGLCSEDGGGNGGGGDGGPA